MVNRDARGRILPGSPKIPGSGLQADGPLVTLRRMLRRPPLPGELDRMIAAFEIPDDVAAELRLVDNGLEALMALAMFRAHSGSWDAWREIMDRVAPKPRAVELSGPGGAPVRQLTVAVGASDAAQLYQSLLAGSDAIDVEFDEDDDLSGS